MISYLRSPFYSSPSESIAATKKLRDFLNLFLLCYGAVFLSGLLVFLIDQAVVQDLLHANSIFDQYQLNMKAVRSQFHHPDFMFIIFLFPIMEELVFRLPLDLKRTSVSLCFSLVIYRLGGDSFFTFNMDGASDYLRLTLAVISFFALRSLITDDPLNRLKEQYYPHMFYWSAAIFAIVHVANFSPIQYDIIYLYPIYVIPQFIMGLFFAYIRIKHGLTWSILLHAAINAPSVLLFKVNS